MGEREGESHAGEWEPEGRAVAEGGEGGGDKDWGTLALLRFRLREFSLFPLAFRGLFN